LLGRRRRKQSPFPTARRKWINSGGLATRGFALSPARWGGGKVAYPDTPSSSDHIHRPARRPASVNVPGHLPPAHAEMTMISRRRRFVAVDGYNQHPGHGEVMQCGKKNKKKRTGLRPEQIRGHTYLGRRGGRLRTALPGRFAKRSAEGFRRPDAEGSVIEKEDRPGRGPRIGN